MPDERDTATLTAPAGRFAPETASAVVDAVTTAAHERTALRIVGGGRWLDAGHRVAAARSLDLSGLRGIVEYVPGDLTLTASAGTTLAELTDATAAHAQWLPLDPFGDPRGTLGATLATASFGPLAGSIGHPRDLTVGVSFVTGEGQVVRGGGRVVKNVAGFDLVRLAIGAWGTLGVITEATVRLRARPEVDESVALALPDAPDALGTLLSTIRSAAVDPLAAELLSPACAARCGLGDRAILLVRLAGNAVSVHHQRTTLANLATGEPVANEAWSRLQQSDPAGGAVVRISRRPSELARLWTTTMSLPAIDAHATLGRGIVRLRLTSDDASALRTFDADDRRVIESGPPAWHDSLQPALPAVDKLSRRLRDAFDPGRLLNPGILGLEAP